MMRDSVRTRAGFTLAEILVALVIVGLVGSGMTRVLLNQNRFFDQQTNLRNARGVARSSINILVNDLRMGQDSGSIESVTSDGKTMQILVPYRFGMVCGTTTTTTTVSLLPTDSGTTAMSTYRGFAFRGATGRYTYVLPANPTSTNAPIRSTTPALCGTAQITTLATAGRAGDTLDLKNASVSGAVAAEPVFLFQRVTYQFAASVLYPNYYGLWRTVEGGTSEEIMAPFDANSKFAYYQSGDDDPRTSPPAVSNIVGLDVNLNAVSPTAAASNNTTHSTSKMVTSIFFKNVRAY